MPFNWDISQETPVDIDALGEPWEVNYHLNPSNDIKAEEDSKLEVEIKYEEPPASGVCPHCGGNLATIKPSGAISTEVEVVVYTDNIISAQNSPTSQDSSPGQSISTAATSSPSPQATMNPKEPVIIDLTTLDNESDKESDSDSARANPYTGKRVNRWPWTDNEKLDLYILKLVYSVSNDELSKILSAKHNKTRGKTSVVAQFAEYRYTPLNQKLYLEVTTTIANNELYRYSNTTDSLKSAARKDLSDEDVTGKYRKLYRRPRTSQKLAPEILYRAYNRSSHGKNGINGFRAGKFSRDEILIPILEESKLDEFDIPLASHIEGEEMEEGSYFISTTPSLLWALHKAFRMGRNPRISVIDRANIFQPVQHVSAIRPRMKAKGLLNGIRYSGKLEYVVYGAIEPAAIIHDFPLEKFLHMVDTDYQIQKVLGSSILFNRTYKKSLMKLDIIRLTKIGRWSCVHVINTVFRFVFNDQISHPLEEVFKFNFAIDWELESRME
ncbi:uncharacterized protein DFL_007563 [Arthrobotrys flagrans]|uniref:DUF7587 domain-containing protein n=1 Tax=Arthrobotrys flagrans TaxID=97331 RepID=A0A436ZW15_ARTFL|nr:hypothetical protein DFL_007563 [Arthrobotrys flagrans]